MADLIAASEQEMKDIGAALASVLRAGDILALSGGLGTGKTTLVRGLLEALGLEEEAPSPSFAIVQPYDLSEIRLPVAHIDLYRLDHASDAEELGLDDYLDEGALAIEWPERLGGRLWPDTLSVVLELREDGTRRLTATVPPSWRDRWPFP